MPKRYLNIFELLFVFLFALQPFSSLATGGAYGGNLRTALDAVISANPGGIADAPNTTENRRIFLGFVASQLQSAGLNARNDILNGNGNPPSSGDLIGIWRNGDVTMERYDAMHGTDADIIGNVAQTAYIDDIPLDCVVGNNVPPRHCSGGGGGGGPLPAPVCGDAYCATEESCNSCAADCGACPIPGTPGISGVNPRVAAPGQTVYIYGEGLTANVLLTSSGQDIGATGVLSADLKTLSFVLPNNAPQGIYNISVGSLTTGLTLKIVDGGGIFNPLGLPPIPPAPTTFAGLVQYVYTYSLYLLGIAVFVMIFYAGFLWMTAAGNGGQIGRAKSIIYNAIIGAILLASAYIILNTINPDLVGGSYTFPGIQGR